MPASSARVALVRSSADITRASPAPTWWCHWLHVDDHRRGVQLVVERGRPGEVHHIGGGVELTNRELTHRLLTAVGADGPGCGSSTTAADDGVLPDFRTCAIWYERRAERDT